MCGSDQTMLDIAEYGSSEQGRFLAHQGNLLSQPPEVQVFDIMVVDAYASTDRIVETLNKSDDGAFPGARSPNKRSRLARGDP